MTSMTVLKDILDAEIRYRNAKGIRPSTAERYHYHAKAFLDWAKVHNIKYAEQVGEQEVKRFIANEAWKYSTGTFKSTIQFLRTSWPTKPTPWDPVRIKATPQPRHSFSIKEAEFLTQRDNGLPLWLWLACMIAAHTGARLESILNLRLEDLSETTMRFRVSKTGAYTVPMPRKLWEILVLYKGTGTPLPFGDKSSNYVSVTFKAFLKKHEIAGSFHSWRHYYASKLAEAGVDMRHAMLLLNHASSIVHRAYVHVNAESLKGIVDRL